MQRFPLKFRQSTYNETLFYQPVVIGRRAVAPGERISRLVTDVRFTSAIFPKANLTPVLAQLWAFYCPWRIVWDQWVDFIALDDAVPDVPLTTEQMPSILDMGVSNKSALMGRAFRLTYNQYFGYETSGNPAVTWYSDPNDPTLNTPRRLLIWDQYRSAFRQGAYASQSYLAAVSGANAVVVLDDLQRALRANRARRKQKMTGDKYVDTMRLMGVELDWRVQMAPEFLGSAQQVLHPQDIQSTGPGTDGSGLAFRSAKFEGMLQLMLKRRLAFAEHGVLFVMAGFRPLVGRTETPRDGFMVNATHFYRPDTVGGPFDETGVSDHERFMQYQRGMNVVGRNDNGFAFTDSGAMGDIYPDPAVWVGDQPSHISMQTDMSVAGLTPVRRGQA